MKTVTMVAALLMSAVSVWAGGVEVIPLVGLVHLDEQDLDTYYNYLAAVPVFRFWDAARFSETPLLTDDAPVSNESVAAASRLVVVGEASKAKVAETRDVYGVSAADTATVEGNVATVAGVLAGNWAQARDVVVAPYAPTGDKTAVASASYAAALASALNAPLLYTYTRRAPYETLSALRRLGARNVFVVDFGASCDDDLLATLAADGRCLGKRFARPDEVRSFVENHIRQSEIKNLPREA